MSRLVPILCVACAVGVGLTAWSRLSASDGEFAVPPRVPAADEQPAEARGADLTGADALEAALTAARRQCTVAAMDRVVARLRASTAEPGGAERWRLLAEALLERAQQRTHLLGLRVGEPIFAELPAEQSADLAEGLAAVAKARELGDESGALFRIEAGLMSQHITGLGSALKWNGRIAAALQSANERTAEDPLLHTALGLRKLLAPRLFGHDPDKALEHFTFAAEASPDDERPAVFAAMATYLQKKRTLAIEWLERAVKRNPNNRFARIVLRRLRRGEQQPFERDVTEAELAAGK